MRRRLAAAAAFVIVLVVALGAWRLFVSPTTSAARVAAPDEVESTNDGPTKPREPTRARRRPESADASDMKPSPPTTTLFRGRAVFDDGSAAVGARVHAFGASGGAERPADVIGSERAVDADGRFEIVGPAGDPRQCVVYGVLPGFAYAGVVAMTPKDDVTLTFVRGGTVTGTVYRADGKPWPDVKVRLVRCDDVGRVAASRHGSVWARPEVAAFYTQTTRTDGAGRFRIGGAPLLTPSDKHSVAVVEDMDGKSWRSDVATFETSGGELVRDVRVGAYPFDEPDPFRRVEGRVVDADGKPIEDAEVMYGVFDGATEKDHRSDTTDNAGRFVFDLGKYFESDGRRLEIRVRRAGFWNWRGAAPNAGEILRVRMTHWDHEPNPGRVLGVATDSNDRPLSGSLEIRVEDEFFDSRRECVVADERGAFTIEGLWQGMWRMSLDAGEPVDFAIRDGDEIRVRLRAKHAAASFAVMPWTDETEAQRVQMHDRSLRARSRAEELKESDEKASETASREADEAYLLFRKLEDLRRDALPRREVLVVGVPTDGSYVVSAENRGRTWRVVAKDGVARFASLSTETWKFAVERFGVATAPREIHVDEGEGPQTIEFSLPK